MSFIKNSIVVLKSLQFGVGLLWFALGAVAFDFKLFCNAFLTSFAVFAIVTPSLILLMFTSVFALFFIKEGFAIFPPPIPKHKLVKSSAIVLSVMSPTGVEYFESPSGVPPTITLKAV